MLPPRRRSRRAASLGTNPNRRTTASVTWQGTGLRRESPFGTQRCRRVHRRPHRAPPGTLRIDTGPGDDSVNWEDTGAAKIWIRTGGGDDEIFLDGGGLGLRSSISMGAGDDSIHASSGVRGPSTIDGGSGDDLAYVALIPFPDPNLPPPLIRRFETIQNDAAAPRPPRL